MCESALLISVPVNVTKKTDSVVKVSLVIHALVLDGIDIHLKTWFRTPLWITNCGNAEGTNSALYFHFFALPLLPNPILFQINFVKVSWPLRWQKLLGSLYTWCLFYVLFERMWLGFRESSYPFIPFWLVHRGFHRVLWQKWETEVFLLREMNTFHQKLFGKLY